MKASRPPRWNWTDGRCASAWSADSGNADNLIEKIKSGEEHFDFVEVMACPYGCIAEPASPSAIRRTKRSA